jgi:hypothetical protein
MMFGQIFAFRGKRDHSPLVEFTDLDALGQVAVLVEEPAHARADFAQLLAESAMGNLEAAHVRPALSSIVCGVGTKLAFEPGQIGAPCESPYLTC